jgi:thiamine pyrophosphate-dependent acetolactate synthase large subunit-like protein
MSAQSNRIRRRQFVAELFAHRGNTLIVPGLGSPNWDIFAAGDSPEFLYSWGGMGLALPTALGVALAQPKRRVLCITGDGEFLMGIGSLAVVGDQSPANLAILVLDNESFSETGRQRGLTGNRMDIAATAKGFGSRTVTEQSCRVPVQGAGSRAGRGQDRRRRRALEAPRERRRHHRPPLPRRIGHREGLTSRPLKATS